MIVLETPYNQIAFYTFQKKCSYDHFELRDLLEQEDFFSQEIIDIYTQILEEGKYYEGDPRLNGKYKQKAYRLLQQELISLSPFFQEISARNLESFMEMRDALSYLSPRLDLLAQIISGRELIPFLGTIHFEDNINYQKEAHQNTKVLTLANTLTDRKITW